MANQQQPARPWFRLASMARPAPAPAPAPAPQVADPAPPPRPTFIRPAFSQTFRQPMPTQPQETTPPPPPVTAPPPAAAPPPPTTVTQPPPPQPQPSPRISARASTPPPPPMDPSRTSAPPSPPKSSQPPSPPISSRASAPPSPILISSRASAPPSPKSPQPPSPPISSRALAPPSPPLVSSRASAPPSPPSPPLVSSRASAPPSPPVVSSRASAPPSPFLSARASTPKTVAPPPSPVAPRPPITITTTGNTTTSFVPTSSLIRTPPPSSPSPISLKPNSPPPKVVSPPRPSLSPPPPPPPYRSTTTAPPTNVTARSITPTPSPITVKPHAFHSLKSPEWKPISHPPSPLNLPPPQINDRDTIIPPEAEQKTVLVQETKEKPNGNLTHNPSNSHIWKRGESPKEKGKNNKYSSDSEDFGMRVITIAGENKGAVMELSPARKKYGFVNNPNGPHKLNGENSSSDKNHNATTKPSPPMTAFMNSNVQGVNNSIVFNSSCTHHDPGVHLSLSRNPNGGRGIHFKERVHHD